MKTCIKCNIEKPLSEYYIKKQSSDGHRHDCKECVKSYQVQYRKENSESIGLQRKKYRETNKEKLTLREHTEKRKQQKREAAKKLKEKDPHYQARWMMDKKQKDPSFRLRLNLSNRIIKAIKKGVKSEGTLELLGISTPDFKSYLESKFLPTMSWDNYGIEWHVDHIIPLQGENVCGLHVPTNLKAIPGMDNLRKSNRYGL